MAAQGTDLQMADPTYSSVPSSSSSVMADDSGMDTVRSEHEARTVIEERTSAWRVWFLVRQTALPIALWLVCNLLYGLLAYWVVRSYEKQDYAINRAIGHLTVVNLGITLLPITRNSVWLYWFKVPFERANIIHRFLARGVFVLATIHGSVWYYIWISNRVVAEEAASTAAMLGQASWLVLFVMLTLALEIVRRNHFEVFYYSHFLFLVLLVLVIAHTIAGLGWRTDWLLFYLLPGIFLYALDRIVRAYRSNMTKRFLSLPPMQRKPLVGATMIEVDRHELTFQPGQYCFLNVPSISRLQWHPYSIASAPSDDKLTFLVRDMGPDTWSHQVNQLANRALRNDSLADDYVSGMRTEEAVSLFSSAFDLRLDGPYGCVGLTLQDYKESVLICGGIGITPAMSLLRDLMAQLEATHRANASKYHTTASTFGRCRLVHLVWVVRRPEHLEWYGSALADLISKCRATSNSLVTVDVQLFVTQPNRSSNQTTSFYVLPRPPAAYMAAYRPPRNKVISPPPSVTPVDTFAEEDKHLLGPQPPAAQHQQPPLLNNKHLNHVLGQPPAQLYAPAAKRSLVSGSAPAANFFRKALTETRDSSSDSEDHEDADSNDDPHQHHQHHHDDDDDMFLVSSGARSTNTTDQDYDSLVFEPDATYSQPSTDEPPPMLEYAFGRPDIDEIFRTIVTGYRSFSADHGFQPKKSVVGVLVCGPPSMELAAQRCCHSFSDSVVEFVYHVQSFIL